jgi:hypothetical protein
MPKKHTPAYTTTKPSYVHPSLQSSRSSASSSTPSEPQSVNQRIHQLRREQAPRATLERRDELTSAVSSRTVPPELRRILHIPEVNGPKPKANSRTRRVLGVARPPPGPAAPTSWLQTSRHAPAYMKKKAAAEQGAARFGTLARVTNEELKVRQPHFPQLMLQKKCNTEPRRPSLDVTCNFFVEASHLLCTLRAASRDSGSYVAGKVPGKR